MDKTIIWLTDRPACMVYLMKNIFPALWEHNITSLLGILNSTQNEINSLAYTVYDTWVSTGINLGYDDEKMQEFEKLVRRGDVKYGTDTVKLINHPFANKNDWVNNVISEFPENVVFGVDIAIRATAIENIELSMLLYSALLELKKPTFLFNTLVCPERSTALWRNAYQSYSDTDVSAISIFDRHGCEIDMPTAAEKLDAFLIRTA